MMFVARSTTYREPGVYYFMQSASAVAEEEIKLESDANKVTIESSLDNVPNIVDNQATQDQWKQKMQKVMGEVPRPSANVKQEVLESFNLHYQSYTTGSAPDGKDDITLGIVRLIYLGSQNGVQQNAFDFPDLDEISRLLWQKLKLTDPNAVLTPIYDCTTVGDEKNNITVTITLKDPDGLALDADDNLDPNADIPTAKSYKHLTFQSLGSSFKLPNLFNKLVFAVNVQIPNFGTESTEIEESDDMLESITLEQPTGIEEDDVLDSITLQESVYEDTQDQQQLPTPRVTESPPSGVRSGNIAPRRKEVSGDIDEEDILQSRTRRGMGSGRSGCVRTAISGR